MDGDKLYQIVKIYLEAGETDYALLINGKWGCGKSHFIEHDLTPKIKQLKICSQSIGEQPQKNETQRGISLKWFGNAKDNSSSNEESKTYKVARVSLYGITNVEDFHVHVLRGLHPLLNNKWVAAVGLLASKMLEAKGVGTNAGDAQVFEANLKEYVIIFDDLERISPNLSVIDVMGWINTYTEQEKCKVIVVCNERAIQEQSELRDDSRYKEYLRYKEKTVRYTLDYEADVDAVYDLIVGNKPQNEKDFYVRNKAIILSLFKQGGHKNLRTLLFVLDCLYNVCQHADNFSAEIQYRLLVTFVIYAMAHKNGATKEQLESIVHEEMVPPTLELDLGEDKPSITDSAKEELEHPQLKSEPVHYDATSYGVYVAQMYRLQELIDYIITGNLDVDELTDSIRRLESEYKKGQATEPGKLVKELHEFADIDEAKFLNKIEQLKTYINSNKYNMYELLDIYAVLLKFHHFRIQGFEITEDITNLFLSALENASESHAYDPRFELCVPMWDPSDESEEGGLYNDLKQCAMRWNLKKSEQQGLANAESFLKYIESNDLEKVKEFKQQDNYIGIIYNMDWERLWNLIISDATSNPVACAVIDALEYWVVKYGSDPDVWKKLHDYVEEYLKKHPVELAQNNNIRIMYLFPLYSSLHERVK